MLHIAMLTCCRFADNSQQATVRLPHRRKHQRHGFANLLGKFSAASNNICCG